VTNFLKIAGAAVLALLALVFVLQQRASANDTPSCAPTTGLVPLFCVNMPAGTSARRETDVPLATVLTGRADVRVESGIPAPEVMRLATSIDSTIARVELAFGRSFATKPRILVFATRASFTRGTQDLFGYSPETAATVAASFGGIFDPQTLTIAVNWQAAPGAKLPSLLAHELTHLATRELVGDRADLPAWFEEGLAAETGVGDAGIDAAAQLAARSLLANAPRTLDTLATSAEWHSAYAQIGPALYAVSAETVRAIQARIGRDALFSLLAEVGNGARFEDAYRTRAGESLAEFIERFTKDLALTPTISVGAAADASGNFTWTLSAFAPNSDVQVRIAGYGYDLAYTVRTDAIGLYRGSFGSTAAVGAYTLSADSASQHATATIDTTPDTEPSRAVTQDRSLQREVASEPAPVAPVAVARAAIDTATLRAYARRAAVAAGIDPNIFERQINAESAFDPNAFSTAGAVGIAQIVPSWHPNVDPTDPYASLDYAARLMRGYVSHFGSYQLALIAYNAGPGRLMPGNPNYLPVATLLSDSFGGGETKRYVAKILGR
jgi:hypothetical protein